MNAIDAHQPEAFELAASAAHALNNIIAVLYAASSHLESVGNPRSLERGTRALTDACGSALCLSAALSLLALPPGRLLSVPAGGQEIHRDDIARICENLEIAASVTSSLYDVNDKPVKTTLDRDTLQSLLLCAAAVLRRAAGRDAQLHCNIRLPHGGTGSSAILEFELCCDGLMVGGSPRHSRTPCELALAYAVTNLPLIDTQLELSSSGSMRFGVNLTE